MNKWKHMMVVAAVLVAVYFAGTAAVYGGEIPMMAAKPHPGASGTLNLTATSIDIQAEGFKPDAVYTVWFVNMKPKKSQAGAGSSPYMFKTGADGKGNYKSTLSESPFGKWAMVMVMLHPDGDSMNMKNMVGALSAMVPERG